MNAGIIGRRVQVEVLGTGNQADDCEIATVVAASHEVADNGEIDAFVLLVLHDDGALSHHYAENATVIPEPPTLLERVVPEWARPHIVEAVAGGVIILGGLALVMAVL